MSSPRTIVPSPTGGGGSEDPVSTSILVGDSRSGDGDAVDDESDHNVTNSEIGTAAWPNTPGNMERDAVGNWEARLGRLPSDPRRPSTPRGEEGGSTGSSSSSTSAPFSAGGPAPSPPLSRAMLFCSGSVAGLAGKTATAPLDRVRILYQVNPDRAFTLSSAIKTGRTIYRNTGLLGLWRGNATVAVRSVPYAGIQFTTFPTYDQYFRGSLSPGYAKFAAGAAAGCTATTLTYPLDLIRARMAAHWSIDPRYSSTVAALREICSLEGPLALTRGLAPTLLGIVPYSGLSFGIFEAGKAYYVEQMTDTTTDSDAGAAAAQNVPLPVRLFLGGLGGLVGQYVSYPFHVVRRRMQVQERDSYADRAFQRTFSSSKAAENQMDRAGVTAVRNTNSAANTQPPAVGSNTPVKQVQPSSSASSSSAFSRQRSIRGSLAMEWPSFIRIFVDIYLTEGLRQGLFKGSSVTLIKGPIAAAVTFTSNDVIKNFLVQRQVDEQHTQISAGQHYSAPSRINIGSGAPAAPEGTSVLSAQTISTSGARAEVPRPLSAEEATTRAGNNSESSKPQSSTSLLRTRSSFRPPLPSQGHLIEQDHETTTDPTPVDYLRRKRSTPTFYRVKENTDQLPPDRESFTRAAAWEHGTTTTDSVRGHRHVDQGPEVQEDLQRPSNASRSAAEELNQFTSSTSTSSSVSRMSDSSCPGNSNLGGAGGTGATERGRGHHEKAAHDADEQTRHGTAESSTSSSTSTATKAPAPLTPMQRLCCGSVAGACAKTVIAPGDRVKILYQTNPSRPFTWSAAFKTATHIYKNDGVLGFWRGHGATLLRVCPYAGISFTVFPEIEHTLLTTCFAAPVASFSAADLRSSQVPSASSSSPATLNNGNSEVIARFLAGALSGMVATTLTYPLDLMRARMAAHWGTKPLYNGYAQGFQHLYHAEGFSSLFKGLRPTLLGIMPYAGLSFGIYENLKTYILPSKSTTSGGSANPSDDWHMIWLRLIAGATAGLVAQSATYPLDITRRRMQVMPANTYRNEFDAIRKIYRTEGLRRGLFKGLSMNYIKGPISVAISFNVNDMLKKWLS
ncbi:unnamed protein product [Amoebophrya sp. A120]|nr:unnamed protein product [Amoebophrya sp. A120]|eukprot:GSA120T00004431001.1